MFDEHYGYPITTDNTEVVQFVNLFDSELLRYGKKMDCILEGVKKYPDELILQIYAAIFYLYSQTLQSQNLAKKHLDQAAQLLSKANEREECLFEGVNYWLNLQMADALKTFEKQCFKWPKDLTALKIAEFLFYCKGQKFECKRFLRLTNNCYNEHKDNPFFLAIHSFALELTSKYEESFQAAERALQINAENPWAHHTLSLVYLKTGLIEKGIDVLEHYSQLWDQFNRWVESHNFWHLALLYLEDLNFEKIEEIYERVNWTHQTRLVSEEIDVSALLWYLDLEGKDNTLHWKKVAENIEDHANFAVLPFISAQLCYALRKGNRELALQEAIQNIEDFATAQVKEDHYIWQKIGLPLLYGALAFTEKNYTGALEYFDPIIDKLGWVGGCTDAQIDLFYQTYLKSLIGAHRYGDAQSLLNQMTQGKKLSKRERKWLIECQR